MQVSDVFPPLRSINFTTGAGELVTSTGYIDSRVYFKRIDCSPMSTINSTVYFERDDEH